MRASLFALATSLLISGCGDSPNATAPDPVDELPIMTAYSGEGQFGVIGQDLAKPLKVRVTKRFGLPLEGVSVTFKILRGLGAIEGETSITDSDGIATAGAWTLGMVTGLQQVRAQTGGVGVTFSAEGCHSGECTPLLFVRDNQIHSLDVITGETRQLTIGGRNAYPVWSPDGTRIAFVRFDENWIADIYLMDADGSNTVRRTNGRGLTFPAWSPDSRRLVVASSGYPYRGEILLMNTEGDAEPVPILQNASLPVWSPDGATIAFVSLSGDDGYQALHIANADGSNERWITRRDEGAIDRPSWSPDGGTLAYSKCIRALCDVHIVDLFGDSWMQTRVGNVESPVWSANGRLIAFTQRGRSGTDPSIGYWNFDAASPVITIVASGYSPMWRPCVSGCVR